MATATLGVMVVLLCMGFPMMIPLIAAAVLGFYLSFGGFGQIETMVSQMLAGIRPASLIAVPMFIFAADIMTRGHSAGRLIDLVMAWVRHVRGGLAISTVVGCTMFGAVSGSTQATVVAVGTPLRPRLLKAGYKDSFVMSLIVNSSDIAMLIPPSIAMIIYGAISNTSIAELFIAGIGPGLLIMVMFSVYCYFYAIRNNVAAEPAAPMSERLTALHRAIWPLGFPAIIIGGIYGGYFSPTEAAAACVLYALVLEMGVFRTINVNGLIATARSTGLITAVVFILVGAGAGFSWIISFAQVPQTVLAAIGIDQMGPIGVLVVISIAFFIGCMFVDPIVVILVMVPIFAPVVNAVGLDPVHVGTIIVLQVAIGSATPPFGCDIFTAIAVFKRPYFEVIRASPPFFLMLFLVSVLLIFFPQIALFLRDLAFGK
ncbi:MAG TPA: TRAP transporter large permease [Paracoccus sp.]|nr:TRAP transporter large permease [Paracoccus sp. (in: a-proteobacteria)]